MILFCAQNPTIRSWH